MPNSICSFAIALSTIFVLGNTEVPAQERYAQTSEVESAQKQVYSKFTEEDAKKLVLSYKTERMIDELCNEYPLIRAINPRIGKDARRLLSSDEDIGHF